MAAIECSARGVHILPVMLVTIDNPLGFSGAHTSAWGAALSYSPGVIPSSFCFFHGISTGFLFVFKHPPRYI